MNFLEILLIIFGTIWIVSLLCYIPKFVSWSAGFKKMPQLKNSKNARIALVIPAKGEADSIAPLFDSINAQTYPSDLLYTFLVVDNEDLDSEDPTIALAKSKLKNMDYLLEKPQKSKGAALKNLFEHIKNKQSDNFDAYIIVDADNILTPKFVEEMNNALISGADVIIGKKLIKNWESNNKKNRNLTSNISALTYTGIDTMGNKYKTQKGFSLAICGQGVLLTSRFIEHFGGFPFTSLTEDIELNIAAILNDFPQYYYEHAKLYAEEPISHKQYNKRRYRWLKGYFGCNKKYKKQLMKKTFGGEKVIRANLNFLFELLPVYFMFGVTCVAFATFLISGIVLSILGSPLAATAWWLTLGAFLLFYLMTAFFNFMLVVEDRETNKMTVREKLAVIFLGPFITMEYGIVLLRVINKNYNVEWEHIERLQL